MGSHLIDLPFWALKLRHPRQSRPTAIPPGAPETYARWLKVNGSIRPAATGRPVKLTWYDGEQRPDVARRASTWTSGASA